MYLEAPYVRKLFILYPNMTGQDGGGTETSLIYEEAQQIMTVRKTCSMAWISHPEHCVSSQKSNQKWMTAHVKPEPLEEKGDFIEWSRVLICVILIQPASWKTYIQGEAVKI